MILRNWKTILFILMAVALFFSVRTCQQRGDTIQTLEHKSDSAFTAIREYKDKNDRLISQVNTQETTLKNFKNYWALDSKRLKAQIGNLNKLVGYWKGKAVLTDSVEILVTDTVYLTRDGFNTDKAFNWSNGHLTLSGGLNTSSNRLSLDYQYQVNFELTSYYKKTGFMKRQLVADLYFSDENLKVREFQSIVIKEKPRKLNLGIGAGYGVVLSGGEVRTGFGMFAGVNYRLF